MPNKYSYSCKFIAKTGNGEELIDILLAAAKLLESNEDCWYYVISKGTDPDNIWVNEVWLSKEAHDKSLEPEEIKATIKRAMPLIDSVSDRNKKVIIGGKGL